MCVLGRIGGEFVGRERICLKKLQPGAGSGGGWGTSSEKVVTGQPNKSVKRQRSHLKPFLTSCHVHLRGTAWYLNEVILEEYIGRIMKNIGNFSGREKLTSQQLPHDLRH